MLAQPIKLTFTNARGKSATLYSDRAGGDHQPYLLQYATGTGGPDTIISTSGVAMGDGTALNYNQVDERLIKTDCMIYGATDEERDINLRKLNGVLDPRIGLGVLSYTDHAGTYTIQGICKALPSFQKRSKVGQWKPVLIDFLCPRPLWKGAEQHYIKIAYIEGGFKLPFRMPFRLGKRGYVANADNPSEIAVPLEIRIQGPADRPTLTNTRNGHTLQIGQSLSGNELLLVDTYYQTVTIRDLATNRERDAESYVDLLGTDWMLLEPGANELRYSSQNAVLGTVVEVFYSDWYLGVG